MVTLNCPHFVAALIINIQGLPD